MKVGLLILVTAGVVALSIALGYFVVRADVGQVAARRQTRYSLLMAGGVLAIGAASGLIMLYLRPSGAGWRDAATLLLITFVAFSWWFVGQSLRRLATAGPRLLTLPRPHAQWFALVAAIGFGMQGLLAFSGGSSLMMVLRFTQVSIAAYYVLIFFVRPQLRGRGVVYQASLIAWADLTGYSWEPDTPNVVTLYCRRGGFSWNRPLLSRISLRVPDEQRARVTEILRHYIPEAAIAGGLARPRVSNPNPPA